jgi:hypothetical protein
MGFATGVLAKSRVCHPERSEGSRFFGRKLTQTHLRQLQKNSFGLSMG